MKRLLLALLVLVLVGSATVGNAATLTILGGDLGVFRPAGRCSTGVVQATAGTVSGGSSTSVLLTFPDACRGLSGQLRLEGAAGPLATTDAVVSLPATGTSVTVQVPSYAAADVRSVALTLGTWGMATSWGWAPPAPPGTGPVVPGNNRTVFTGPPTWTEISGGRACVSVEVTTVGSGQALWAVDLLTTQRPFNGATTFEIVQGASWTQLMTPAPVSGVLRIEGANGSKDLKAGQTRAFMVCSTSTPIPAYDPALAYTVTSSAPSADLNPCITTSVAVTGTPFFYAGWRADVDMGPAVAALTAAGGTFSGTVMTTTPGTAVQPLGGTVWRAVPTAWSTAGVRDGTTQTVTLCAVRG